MNKKMAEQIGKNYDALKTYVDSLADDVSKFVDGNGAAGVRVRKGMMEIKNRAHAIRQGVSEAKAS